MHGTLAAILVPSVATVAIIGMVSFAGGQFSWSSTPPLPDPTDSEHAICHDARLKPVGQAAVSGNARVCLGRAGVQVVADVEQLEPDVTYSAWLGYFERPELCATTPCAETLTAQERADGVFERIDSLTPDLGRRASVHRGFREIMPATGAQLQIVLFKLGPLGTMLPADRVKLLVTWPLDPVRGVAGSAERRNPASLVARAMIKLYENPQSNIGMRRRVG